VFHVTQKGTGGISMFVDDLDRERFRLLLSRTDAMFEWELHAWCLMGTHYHLLIQGPREQVSAGMHRLAGLYAQGFNCRWERKGHLFEERFSSRLIRDDDHFRNAVDYILNNPVRAGLCKDRRDWKWSWPRFDLPQPPDLPWPYGPCPGDCPPDMAGKDEAARRANARWISVRNA